MPETLDILHPRTLVAIADRGVLDHTREGDRLVTVPQPPLENELLGAIA